MRTHPSVNAPSFDKPASYTSLTNAIRLPSGYSTAEISASQQGGPGMPVLASPTGFLHRESWPIEGREYHLAGAEPRIFPGVVSKAHRRGSLRRRSSGDGEGVMPVLIPPVGEGIEEAVEEDPEER